jgi:hypothetical protein
MYSLIGGEESYINKSYCNIEEPLPFLKAEEFQMFRCFNPKNSKFEPAEYPGGMDRFYAEIAEKMTIYRPTLTQGLLEVQMTIDTKGRMKDFKAITNTGYEEALIRVLATMRNWTPTKINSRPMTQYKVVRIHIR